MADRPAPAAHDDIDNYNVDDFADDPFASPSPPASSKKRKEAGGGLGLDKEVSVQKRVRIPNVKLDEDRLLSAAGIPRLRERAKNLKLKGKGHEFSDAARLLSFYQLWLDDLFPKARFLDALAMVEKAGHKKRLMDARNLWLSEDKPKDTTDVDGGYLDDNIETEHQPLSVSVRQYGVESTARPSTPDRDVPDDDDLYGTTPKAARLTLAQFNDDEDDLDALIAEADKQHDDVAQSASHSTGEAKNGHATDFADDEAAMLEMEGW